VVTQCLACVLFIDQAADAPALLLLQAGVASELERL